MIDRPNVLVVMSDEQSWNTMGCTGNPAARTPHLDELCGEATSFDRAYTPFPLCCPSRASLWTGRMPRHHGVLGNWRPIAPELAGQGLAQRFQASGYHTMYTGKWHVPGTTPERMGWVDTSAIPAVVGGRDRGRFIPDYRQYAAGRGYIFDQTHIENLTAGDIARIRRPGGKPYATADVALPDFLETWQTSTFLEALERRPRDRPWLAACSFNAPHFPMVVPEPYDRLIDRSAVQLPASWVSGPGEMPQEVRQSHYATDFRDLTESDWVEVTAHYLGLCALVDAQLGRIVSHLKATGQWDRTVVVFTSDHGDMMGAHRLMEKGHFLHYDEDLRVPLLVRHPDGPGGRTDNLVSVCDVAPSIAELAGVEWELEGDGRSFADQVGTVGAQATRAYVTSESFLADGRPGGDGSPFRVEDWQFPRDSINASIRTPTLRYTYRSHDQDELFYLVDDPGEQRNLAAMATHHDDRTRLRHVLADELGDCFPTVAGELRTVPTPPPPGAVTEPPERVHPR